MKTRKSENEMTSGTARWMVAWALAGGRGCRLQVGDTAECNSALRTGGVRLSQCVAPRRSNVLRWVASGEVAQSGAEVMRKRCKATQRDAEVKQAGLDNNGLRRLRRIAPHANYLSTEAKQANGEIGIRPAVTFSFAKPMENRDRRYTGMYRMKAVQSESGSREVNPSVTEVKQPGLEINGL